MIELHTEDQIKEAVVGKRIVSVETRKFTNTRFNTEWTATGFVLDDGTFLAICSDDEPDFILLKD